PGAEVRVHIGAMGTERAGRVAFIHPAADLQTRAFEVEVEVPNPDGALLPGMIAQVEVSQPLGAERPVIPQHVLVTRLEGNGVFVAEPGDEEGAATARWRPVRVEAVVRDQIVVASGLEAGDHVVVVGHRELAEGDELLVTREGRCCTGGRVTYGPATAAAPAAPSAEDPG
ncbi:MAG: efflux RND transporter periplasmic adaptor subunit, partial [Myxococcota bacterium]